MDKVTFKIFSRVISARSGAVLVVVLHMRWRVGRRGNAAKSLMVLDNS